MDFIIILLIVVGSIIGSVIFFLIGGKVFHIKEIRSALQEQTAILRCLAEKQGIYEDDVNKKLS